MGRPAPTRNGYDFFVVSSLLQKALRRGDIVLAAKACVELLPRYRNYAWNRLMVVSAEDCHDLVTHEIVALYEAWRKVGGDTTSKKPGKAEGWIYYAKAIVLLAKCQHSRDQDELIHLVVNRMPPEVFEAALAQVEQVFDVDDGDFEIPAYVYDKHTQQGRRMGKNNDDFLREEHDDLVNAPPSVFGNFDQMLETWGYVEPVVTFPDDKEGE